MVKRISFVFILVLALFMRSYQYVERYSYSHDTDLAAWVMKDIVFDHHQRLIGQLTSAPGIFIGSLFYYLQIPFYFMSGMDPIGTVWLSVIIGILATASMFWVGGPVAGLIYAGSFLISSTEREVVPTTLVMLWSMWFYKSLIGVWAGQKKWLYIFAILTGFIWHINLALVLGIPLILIGIIKNFKNLGFKHIFAAFVLALIINLPLLAFEARHGFIQLKSLAGNTSALGTQSKYTDRLGKFNQTVRYAMINANRIFKADDSIIPLWIIPVGLLASIWFLHKKRILILSWIGLYIVFFSLHPLPLSEYYLNGLTVVWVIAAALLVQKLPRYLSAGILILFLIHNLYLLFSFKTNGNGYIERKGIIDEIYLDAKKHDYPCVSVSYITDTGYNLGYRYLFFLNNMHTVNPDTDRPVYSIVFPMSRVDSIDKSFGALGLIYPEYDKFNQQQIAKICQEPNWNITDSMFGFTK